MVVFFKTSEIIIYHIINPVCRFEGKCASLTLILIICPGLKSVKEEIHRTVGQWCRNQFK